MVCLYNRNLSLVMRSSMLIDGDDSLRTTHRPKRHLKMITEQGTEIAYTYCVNRNRHL